MVAIKDAHVEWRVVARLHELLDRPPEAEHDVTLTYALFTSTICWTCQRLRDTKTAGSHQGIWSELGAEMAFEPPWNIGKLQPVMIDAGDSTLETLPASWLLVGLRNGLAHGDHRTVEPHHTAGLGADRELRGFKVTTSFLEVEKKKRIRDWGRWTLILTRPEMRRIGLMISGRFVNALDRNSQEDARRHVVGRQSRARFR